MGKKFDCDHAVDFAALLLNKETGDKEGRIVGYYGSSTFHVRLELYVGNCLDGAYHSGVGTAGGGNYDKVSAGLADALIDAGIHIGDMALRGSCARFTARKYETLEEVARIAKEQKAIPVYAGSGNEDTAFGIWWRIERVV